MSSEKARGELEDTEAPENKFGTGFVGKFA